MKHRTKNNNFGHHVDVQSQQMKTVITKCSSSGLSDKRIKIGALSKKVQKGDMAPIVLRVLEKYGPTYL